MSNLDLFFHDLKLLLWSNRSGSWITASARARLAELIDNVRSDDPADATRLLIQCQQRLKMLEHIAGATPILRELHADLDRAARDIDRDRRS